MNLSANQIKHNLRQQGQTLKSFAQANGFKYRTVSDVVRGLRQGNFGEGREVRMKLGLPIDDQVTLPSAIEQPDQTQKTAFAPMPAICLRGVIRADLPVFEVVQAVANAVSQAKGGIEGLVVEVDAGGLGHGYINRLEERLTPLGITVKAVTTDKLIPGLALPGGWGCRSVIHRLPEDSEQSDPGMQQRPSHPAHAAADLTRRAVGTADLKTTTHSGKAPLPEKRMRSTSPKPSRRQA